MSPAQSKQFSISSLIIKTVLDTAKTPFLLFFSHGAGRWLIKLIFRPFKFLIIWQHDLMFGLPTFSRHLTRCDWLYILLRCYDWLANIYLAVIGLIS